MAKLERIKAEILRDHEANDFKGGRLSLTDKYNVENYGDYKAVVNELNEDINFPYTVYIMRINQSVKIQYSRLGSKFYDYKQPSEGIEVLERLIN